jgi:phosphoribosylanthranilate isomerase
MTSGHFFVKICGITRVTDAVHAVEHGATAIGFVLWRRSPRGITPDHAAAISAELPAHVMRVGVFVNEPVESIRAIVERAQLTAIQLHGEEPPAYAEALDWPVFRAVSVEDLSYAMEVWAPETALLVDNIDPVRRGGTGSIIDWSQAAAVAQKRRVVLAGGLTADNVASAIRAVRPFGVDVSSGVEASPGVKDLSKVTQFIANAREAFEESK